MERALDASLAERSASAAELSERAPQLVDALREFTLRGGKRLRAAVLHAGFCAVAGPNDPSRTARLGVALELLQSYLLIQDDWMDGDRQRRGGPSVHIALAERHDDAHLGASLAMLASDLASGFAWEALVEEATFPPHRLRDGLLAFGRMHFEVVCGQQLDLIGDPDVARMHQLKTGSYTVRGPLVLGAIAADASPEQRRALERFGEPLGRAFQLRDDLLGAFGAPGDTGKPVGADLLAGKHNAVIAALRGGLAEPERAAIDRVYGRRDATPDELSLAVEALRRSGAEARVEQELQALMQQARDSLQGSVLHSAGVPMLLDLVALLGLRRS